MAFTKRIDWILIFILIVAAFLRFFLLDLRPTHHDEGVYGWFVDQITANGFYRYDPTNYHGPLHYYVLFLSQTLFGRNNFVLRLPDALISLLTVYWVTLFSRFFGRRTCLISALAMALSPGITYFGRYAFQESFLVFYTILVLWGIIGLYLEGTKKYLWACGLGITLMILTKETYIIHIGCFLLALAILFFTERISLPKQNWNKSDLEIVIWVSVLLIVFFYSGMFHYPRGLYGLFETFNTWTKTGLTTSGHTKPFFFWLWLFLRYEQVALIGLICSIFYLIKTDNKFVRYIAIYGLLVFIAYSLISYKTPWLIINLIWPFCFIFGYFVDNLLKTKFQTLIQLLCLALFITSLVLGIKINYFNYANKKEPYVYVHTTNDIKKLTCPVFKLVKQNPANYNLVGHFIRTDEWPFPWIFGEFTMIGYYKVGMKPTSYDADFLLVQSNRVKEVEKKLKRQYFTDIFVVRDAQDPSKIYLNHETFKNIFPGRKPEFVPE